MALFQAIPLRRAWYALVLLASLLPALALAPWLSDQAHRLLLDRAMLRELLAHQQLEMHLYLETKRLVSVLQNKSDPIAFLLQQGHQDARIRSLLSKIDAREKVINTTTLYDPAAHLLMSNREQGHVIAPIDRQSPAFVIAMHQRVFIGSPARLDDGHYEFLIAVPLIADGQTMGVMVSTININKFWRYIKSMLPKHDARTYLIDGRGTLLIHQEASRLQQGALLSDKAIVRALLAHKDWHRSDTYRGFEGEAVFGIGTHVRNLQWGLISEIPASSIISPIVSVLVTLILIVVVIHLLFGLGALLFSDRMLRPISNLAAVMQRAAGGDYHPQIPASRFREIDDLGRAFQSMLTEIDRREKMLRQLNLAIEHLGESIIVTNRDGIIEYVNPAFTRMSGYTRDEVRGQSPKILNSGTQPKSFYERFWATIQRGENWEGRLVNRRKDGELYPVLMSVAPIFEGDEITHFVAVQQDMDEYDQLENQLRQSQKMEAIGTLVGGIAHDFNNMLAGMTGNLYLAKHELPAGSSAVKRLEDVEQLAMRAADMIQQLLTFARKDRVDMQVLQLTSFVKGVMKFLAPSIPENILLHQQIGAEPLPVRGDETQLHQVVMNLVNNARDALENTAHPEITVRLERCHVDAEMATRHEAAEVGDYAHLMVSDNGMGIDPAHIEHLFEPFFTTKEQGKGTGLGLSMVFGAVRTHAGFVDVESAIGAGTTFHIYLPLQSEAEAAQRETRDTVAGHGELILLVDDEAHVLQTTAEVLESLGYRVLQASDGEQAIAQFKAHADEVKMVISDVVMPHCGGRELAEAVHAIAPAVPFIFVTGYERGEMGSDTLPERSVMMSKPVHFDELSDMISKLLAS